MAAPGGKIDPIGQFQIKKIVPLDIGGVDASFTNSSLFMVIVLTNLYLYIANRRNQGA